MNLLQTLLCKAKQVQPDFASLSFSQRSILLKQAGREMLLRREEVISLLSEETYKIYPEILLSEVIGPLQFIKDWIRVAKPFLKPKKIPISPFAFPRKKAWVSQLPRGVVGIITPFNYPLGNFFKPVFAALLSGNAVIIKPSEYAPKTAEWFVHILNQFLPQDILSLYLGDGQAGEELILSGVDAITFTGSFKTGQKVAILCAQKMIPCSFELGGKDAAIVLADCNLDRTLAGILHWSFHNAGQSCGAIDRVYLEACLADQFVERLVQAARGLDHMIAPVVPPHHPSFLAELIQDALAHGAQLVLNQKTIILDHCNHHMRIMREPTFGPVLPIMRVQNAEEALAWVNQCDYGLNASIWSQNISKATQIAKQFQVGTSYINNHAFTGAIPAAPWTGVKHSGYGIANSTFALMHYTRPHTLVIDRKKSADAWWYPLNTLAARLGECLALAQLGSIQAALQVPYLIYKRQKEVLNWVKIKKPLFGFEARWGKMVMDICFDESDPKAEDAVQDLYHNLPFLPRLGMRASLWILGLSPLWQFKAFKTLSQVKPEQGLEILKKLYHSNSYFMRQTMLLLKINGSFFYARTTRHFSRSSQ